MNRVLVVALTTLTCVAAPARADDPAAAARAARTKAELKARAEKYLTAGVAGVQVDAETDLVDGRYVRMFVVGTATISTVLGAAEGLEIAKEKAEERAKAAYVKWLGSRVRVIRTSADEVLLLKEGEDGGAGRKDQGKLVERSTKGYEETAAGLVRGLKLVAYEQKGAERTVIAVYRWDAPAAGGGKSPAAGTPAVIPDKKVVIDDDADPEEQR